MPTKLNHTHTYIKYTPDTFRCADPHCYYHVKKDVLVGKASLCNLCGKEFILTREDLRRRKPRCADCSQTKKAVAKRAAGQLMQDLFNNADNVKDMDRDKDN